MTRQLSDDWILVKGAGDLGTGVAWQLFKAGAAVVLTELADPLVVRRTVSFAPAVWQTTQTVEGVTARYVRFHEQAREVQKAGEIPILVDPDNIWRWMLRPRVVIDATIAKVNTGTRIDDAPLVVALGPGFAAGIDCHAVIETQRGHTLGRIYWKGSALANTGTPGEVMGHGRDRVLRAPCDGILCAHREIGDKLHWGDIVATVSGELVVAPFPGVLRGLIRDAHRVTKGMKVGDVDPRGVREHCFTLSDKALALGGAALVAIMMWQAST
ncbi:MAG: EF2563 family selenium-dependent molybdenum hydroxylase system protein [Anaerolineae bacterium]|nr:EF2563 family selenium-dependent molybdenum hydroxylase system protein [Anaerolineae bacterium]